MRFAACRLKPTKCHAFTISRTFPVTCCVVWFVVQGCQRVVIDAWFACCSKMFEIDEPTMSALRVWGMLVMVIFVSWNVYRNINVFKVRSVVAVPHHTSLTSCPVPIDHVLFVHKDANWIICSQQGVGKVAWQACSPQGQRCRLRCVLGDSEAIASPATHPNNVVAGSYVVRSIAFLGDNYSFLIEDKATQCVWVACLACCRRAPAHLAQHHDACTASVPLWIPLMPNGPCLGLPRIARIET